MALKRSLPAASAPVSPYGIDGIADFERVMPDDFVDWPNRLQSGLFTSFGEVASISDLEARGVSEKVIDALTELVNAGVDEKTVVTLFLYLLSQQKSVKKMLDRSITRVLAKAYKQLPDVPGDVQQRVKTAIATHLQTIGG